jgi:hypothetical protein
MLLLTSKRMGCLESTQLLQNTPFQIKLNNSILDFLVIPTIRPYNYLIEIYPSKIQELKSTQITKSQMFKLQEQGFFIPSQFIF